MLKGMNFPRAGTGEHLIRTLFASRCVEALRPSPASESDSESEAPPMRLKRFIEENFVSSPVVSGGASVNGAAAGVIGTYRLLELSLVAV